MSCLLIFDENISPEDMDRISIRGEKSIGLFPLTTRQYILDRVTDKCYANGIEKVKIIETGRIINETADKIRDKYIEFIAKLPDKFNINGKNLKEWFYHPEGGISLWWLSLIAEKNTLKSDSFNRLVQLYSTIRVIEEHKVTKIILSCNTKKLRSALALYCKENSLSFVLLPDRKEREISELNMYPTIKAFMGACVYLGSMLMRWLYIKHFTNNLKMRISNTNNPVLVVTYYPNIDTEFASKGIFKNKYYLALQEELEKQGNDIIWIAISVHNTNISFRESLEYARKFIKNRYHFVFLEEFLTVTSFIKIFRNMVWSWMRFKKIEKELPNHHYFSENVSCYPIFQEDWYSSFCGSTSMEGFLYFEAFKNMFKKLKGIRKGVYYCEMHAWEKALLAAKGEYADDVRLFGYQHSTFPKMLLNHFNHPSELQEADSKYAMPKPDKIACDGQIPYNYFRQSGWSEDELTIVEAIRYGHLRDITRHEKKLRDFIILVAFSISIEESAAILNVVYEGLKDVANVKVWLKPHPFLLMDQVLKKSGISISDTQFEIKEGKIEMLLPDVECVIISQSSVALEALAYGCKIITLNIPDMVNMSPLRGIHSNLIRYVTSASELKNTVNELMKEEEENNSDEIKELLNQFFYFNKTSVKPEKFLDLLS